MTIPTTRSSFRFYLENLEIFRQEALVLRLGGQQQGLCQVLMPELLSTANNHEDLAYGRTEYQGLVFEKKELCCIQIVSYTIAA